MTLKKLYAFSDIFCFLYRTGRCLNELKVWIQLDSIMYNKYWEGLKCVDIGVLSRLVFYGSQSYQISTGTKSFSYHLKFWDTLAETFFGSSLHDILIQTAFNNPPCFILYSLKFIMLFFGFPWELKCFNVRVILVILFNSKHAL